MQAEFDKNLAFALDLAPLGRRAGEPKSHLGNTAPDLVPTTFPISYGEPQTVEVNAKRELGAVTLHWRVNGGASTGRDQEFKRRRALRRAGIYYHRLRGAMTGMSPATR